MTILSAWLMCAALIFSIGLYGILTHGSRLGRLLSVELMANAVHLNLVALGQHRGDETGQVMAFVGIGLTLVSISLGLALIMAIDRDPHAAQTETQSEQMP